GAALPAVGDARRVERSADHLVAEAREILDAAAADQHDGVLLEVVPLTGNVRADFHAVRQPHAGDLAKSRVRLLGQGRVDAGADTGLVRRSAERRCLHLALGRDTSLAYELVYGGHELPGFGPCMTKAGRGSAPANRHRMVANSDRARQTGRKMRIPA